MTIKWSACLVVHITCGFSKYARDILRVQVTRRLLIHAEGLAFYASLYCSCCRYLMCSFCEA